MLYKVRQVCNDNGCYHDNRFGCQAGSYDQVIQGCRLAWNAGIDLVLTDRELLQLPYMEMLSHVMSLAGRRTEVNMPIKIIMILLL